MLHQAENYSWKTPTVSDGDEFIMCNLVQETPLSDIFNGVTGLKFYRCNLVNIKLPPDAQVELCNTAQIEYELEE